MSDNPINLSAGWWLAEHRIDEELPRGGDTDRALFPTRYTAQSWLIERIGDSIDDLEDYISDFEADAAEQGDDLQPLKEAISDLRKARESLRQFPLNLPPFEAVYHDCSVRLAPVAVAWQPVEEAV